MTLVSLIAAGLIFYGFYKWHMPESLLFSIGSAAVAFIMLLCTMAISFSKSPRSSVMFKTVSAIFFIVMLVVDIFMSSDKSGETTFIIVNGLAICLWLVITYGIARSKQ